MPYQFFHVEAYSVSGSKPREKKSVGKKKLHKRAHVTPGRLSIAKVMAEARRDPGAIPHVTAPQPPEVLIGDLSRVEQTVQSLTLNAMDSLGRKIRKDKLLLLGIVASYPDAVAKLDRNDLEFRSWVKSNLDYLSTLYQDQLIAACIHWDEKFPHIHAYVITRDLQIRSIHRGIAASDAATSDKKKAYNAAMRDWQTEYSKMVGMKHGQTRRGPGGRRLSRLEWNAEQDQAKALKLVADSAAQMHQQVILEAQAKTMKMRLAAKNDADSLVVGTRRKLVVMEAQVARRIAQEIAKAKKDAEEIRAQAVSDRARLVGEAASILERANAFVKRVQTFAESFIGFLPPTVRESATKALWALGNQADAMFKSIQSHQHADGEGKTSTFKR